MQAKAYEEGLRLSADGRHAEAIGALERALAEQPDDARILFALGNTARTLGMAAAAERFYRMVLALEPERLEALVNLANLLRASGDAGAAVALLEPAASRAPDSHTLWLALGSAHRERGDAALAEAAYRQALALKPDYVQALVNLADLRSDADAREEAHRLYARALALDPGNAAARLHRAMLNLEQGRLIEGWRDYEGRLGLDAIVHDHALPLWRGEALNGKSLLVTAEQGVGDELMFASVLADVKEPVVLECDARLVALLARSFPQHAVRPSQIRKIGAVMHAHHAPVPDAAAAIAIGSLPLYLRESLAAFPAPHIYLVPDAEETARWRAVFSGGAHIGLCWRSGKRTNGRALQYAPLQGWARLLRDLPATPVCAQYDASAEEIAELEALSGRKILVPPGIDQKNELDRTCAMLSALDCVVSAPTAVSWLAAGAGVRTFKILYRASWTSFGTDHEPFAPSCRSIAPDSAGDWAAAFAKVSALIREQVRPV